MRMGAFCLALVLAVGSCGRDTVIEATPVAGDDGMKKSPAEVAVLVADARNGDLQAANTLAVHFRTAGDNVAANSWLLFAARSGDCNAWEVLSESMASDSSDVTRSFSQEIEKVGNTISCPEVQ
jgi:hypothetical protein